MTLDAYGYWVTLWSLFVDYEFVRGIADFTFYILMASLVIFILFSGFIFTYMLFKFFTRLFL